MYLLGSVELFHRLRQWAPIAINIKLEEINKHFLSLLHLQVMGICKATRKPCIIRPYLSPVFIYSVFLMLVEEADIIVSGNEFHTLEC